MKFFPPNIFFAVSLLSCTCTATNFETQEANQPISHTATEIQIEKAVIKTFLYLSNGKLTAKKESILYSKTTGILTSLNVKTGAWVKKGSVLAQIENDKQKIDVEKAKAALL